jgi:hypothetical protein
MGETRREPAALRSPTNVCVTENWLTGGYFLRYPQLTPHRQRVPNRNHRHQVRHQRIQVDLQESPRRQ